MPVKVKGKKAAKTAAAKKATRTVKPVAKARMKKGDTYECRVCGYRFVVDQACGCAEEHLFVCCDKPMKKKRKMVKKAAAKK